MPTALLTGLAALALTATTQYARGDAAGAGAVALRRPGQYDSDRPAPRHSVLTKLFHRGARLTRSRSDHDTAAELPREPRRAVWTVGRPVATRDLLAGSSPVAAPGSPRAPPATLPS